MALGIAEPAPLRTVGGGTVAGGALATIFAGFRGPAALVGVVALCAGISLLDGVDRGRMGRRQLGLFLIALAGVLGAWALVVTVLIAMLGLPPDPMALGLLAGAILAGGGAVYLLRYGPEPRQSPAIVAEPSAKRKRAARRRSPAVTADRLDRLAS
ncbi:MAG: hypothetical protein ACRDKA_06305 [Actinomycetota bacterium]